MLKTKLEDRLLQIFSLYSMTNPLLWFQKISADAAEECIVVFLDIRSANIADHIIDADIYDEVFVYFLDELEGII